MAQILTTPTRARSTFIDPSLARGIRSSYFGSLSEAWNTYLANERADFRRQPCKTFSSAKSFRKEISTIRRQRLPQFLPISEISIRSGKREAWMMLTLTSLCDSPNDELFHNAALFADLITFPADAKRSIIPVFFRRHAVERVIQRSGVVDLPLKKTDIEAIHAEFSTALVWAMAASMVFSNGSELNENLSTVVIPSDNGIFIGEFLANSKQLILKTYVEKSMLRDEQRYALNGLYALDHSLLALAAIEGFVPGWSGDQGEQIKQELLDVWRRFGWLLKERNRQPDELELAWQHFRSIQN
jgi:hypothetical protein